MNANMPRVMLILVAVATILMMGISWASGATPGKTPGTVEDGSTESASTTKPVAKIVFLDKENCCKCTGERTEKSWNALQAALKAKTASVPVERVHVDTQAEQAGTYKALKPMVTVPALYFLDADGNLVDMLQGEVTQAQVEKLL